MDVRLLTAGAQWGGLEGHTVALAATLEARGHAVEIVELGTDVFARRSAARKITTPLRQLPLDNPHGAGLPLRAIGGLTWWRMFKPIKGGVCVYAKGNYEEGSWQMDAAARLRFRRYITIEQLSCPMPYRSSRRHLGGLVRGVGFWWYRLALRRLLRSPWAHCVVCVSDAVKRPLLRHYGFASRKLSTVHNGIDVAKYRPDPERHATARRAWGVPPEAFVFGAVGRLARVKGLATAIDLFARLLEETRRSDLWLVLVGDGPERPALECRAREKGAAARVVFPGFTDAPEEAYPGIDTFVMPSRNEGLPLALVEAMASGCCPIAMGVGGVPEVIVNPSIGWLIAPSAEEDFFQAMAAASRLDRQAAADMGRRARGYVLAHFDERVQLAALADIIDSAARS